MEINGVKPMDGGINYPITPVADSSGAANTSTNQTTTAVQVKEEVKPVSSEKGEAALEKPKAKEGQPKELTEEELLKMNAALNRFMQLMDANIQFTLHEKTNRLIVRVVDSKEGKVLKEFPPKEMLDVMARIREYVGALLDKKA